ncbi:phosphoribosylglycinamide formyltransferase [Paludicola sp. MB14-C6]|uniref:phosphoribosylglycinamide formyltransferase n=1 Tax=Paludihabitans sp. MB14-C6 TaxID=3070656 RepID=UPI0027DB18BD|nr:phosphoribosylglycinamide formyltransferase [Paludicola sp. MB14-C6]WMJ21847.1 phosphoribosylglycinamide formyltransferase [Paludicola sp. MB14-C6]
MLNIAVLVSGGGTNLQALIDAQKNGDIKNGQIKLVVASNDKAYALERAKQNNIATCIIARKTFDKQADFDEKLIATLKDHNIDLIVLAGYLSILTKRVTDCFYNRIINVHPALIPSFCGAGYYGLKVHEAALQYGVKLTGATVHFVNEVADGGAIILQKAVAVEKGDTPEILQKRVMEQAEWMILPQAVSLFCEGKIKVVDNKAILSE